MTQKLITAELYPWEHAIFDMMIERISWATGGNLCYAATISLNEEGGHRFVENQALAMVANIENQHPLLEHINIDMLNRDIDAYEWIDPKRAMTSDGKRDSIKRKGAWTSFTQWWHSLETEQQAVFEAHGFPSLRTGETRDGLTLDDLMKEAGLNDIARDKVKFYVTA